MRDRPLPAHGATIGEGIQMARFVAGDHPARTGIGTTFGGPLTGRKDGEDE
jgi:hypothetical protein